MTEQTISIIRALAIRKRKQGTRSSDNAEIEAVIADAGRKAGITTDELTAAWHDLKRDWRK